MVVLVLAAMVAASPGPSRLAAACACVRAGVQPCGRATEQVSKRACERACVAERGGGGAC